MRWFDVGQEATGVIAVGQLATGVIAIGQMATGVVAVGQLARGVFVVGQLSLGVAAVGQVGFGVGWVGGLVGIGGRAGFGFVLGLFGRSEESKQRKRARQRAKARGAQSSAGSDRSAARRDVQQDNAADVPLPPGFPFNDPGWRPKADRAPLLRRLPSWRLTGVPRTGWAWRVPVFCALAVVWWVFAGGPLLDALFGTDSVFRPPLR